MTTSSDHDRFAELYTQNRAKLYGYIYSLLPNRSDAEDVSSSTTLILWKKWDSFDQGGSFIAWARGIALNEVRNFLRKHSRRDEFLSEPILDQLAATAAESDIWLDQRKQALADCIARLLPEQQRLIELRYMASATNRTTAEQVGQTTEATYKKVSRIRHLLFDCIERTLAQEENK